MTREELQQLLRTTVCEVTFTKVNGETRTMPCTLKEDLLPTRTNTESAKSLPASNISVWCTDKNEWRSFRVTNVTEVRVIGS
jgi:hypothetical protein